MTVKRYLVCRTEAIKPAGTMRTSEYFPTVVSARDPEEAVYEALRINRCDYSPADTRMYLAVDMKDASIVKLERVERPSIRATVRRYTPFMSF